MRTTCKHWQRVELLLLKKLYATTWLTHKEISEEMNRHFPERPRTRQAVTHKIREIYKSER